jgi:hypothetical protein
MNSRTVIFALTALCILLMISLVVSFVRNGNRADVSANSTQIEQTIAAAVQLRFTQTFEAQSTRFAGPIMTLTASAAAHRTMLAGTDVVQPSTATALRKTLAAMQSPRATTGAVTRTPTAPSNVLTGEDLVATALQNTADAQINAMMTATAEQNTGTNAEDLMATAQQNTADAQVNLMLTATALQNTADAQFYAILTATAIAEQNNTTPTPAP